MTQAQQSERRLLLAATGALGYSCVITQLALMRELWGAFSGNEMVLGIVLGLWLLLMGIGTWLGRTADTLRRPFTFFVVLQTLVAVVPLLQVFLLRALRNVVFTRGATVGIVETVAGALVLLLPYCLVAGYSLTLACSLLGRCADATDRTNKTDRLEAATPSPSLAAGRVYVADGVGSILGGMLFSLVLVRFLDHIGILLFPALVNLLAAALLAFRAGQWTLAAMPLLAAGGVLAAGCLFDLDAVSTRLQYPHQHVVARFNSPYGRLLVLESDGQFDFIDNGIPLTSTRDQQHVEEAVHYAMAQRPESRRALLVGGGISGTAREILRYNVRQVDYVELDPLILELGRRYLPVNLADNRIRILKTDGRLFIRQTTNQYDVVILDIPDPSTAQLSRFYTAEFMAQVKRTLAPGGVLSFGLGHYENYVSPELARLLASAHRSVKQAFQNVQLIPGGRVFFLASDGELSGDIASRIEARGVATKLVNRHYLDAMLAADRIEDMRRAIAQPAALNRDFSPVLYYYHLRHWLSQFKVGFGVLPVALLFMLGLYLVRLRGAAVVLFASGFAGTALEIVLLLAFQVLCGSVYHQVGVIVTVFMAGLAMGALLTSRLLPGVQRRALTPALSHPMGEGGPALAGSGEGRFLEDGRRLLVFLAMAIAGFALLLPLVLPLLGAMGGTTASLFLVKGVIALLTFLLAALVGMQFPLANRLEFDGTVAGVSRLYTADLIGACLGALLTSTLLLPLMGLAGVCLLTAALNFVAGGMMQFRKNVT